MSLVLCTADITPEASQLFWEDFVRRSKAEHIILLRSPEDKPTSRLTEPQIEPFQTGFKGWSTTKLRKFIREYLCADTPGRAGADERAARHGEALKGVNESCFVVIDEESVREGKSIAMHDYGLSDFRQHDDWQWTEWRVAVDGAQAVLHCMLVKSGTLLWEGGADEDGLLRCGS